MATALRTFLPGWCPHDIHEVVHAAAKGDQTAWNELVTRYTSVIWSVARGFRFNHEDAADVVQNTWLRLTMHLHAIHTPEALPRWLTITARHECVRLLRWRREQARTTEHLDRASEERGPAEAVVNREVLRTLHSAMTALSQRDVRLLHLLMQDSRPHYAEIASALGMPVGSIGPSRSRALSRLRAELTAADVTSPAG